MYFDFLTFLLLCSRSNLGILNQKGGWIHSFLDINISKIKKADISAANISLNNLSLSAFFAVIIKISLSKYHFSDCLFGFNQNFLPNPQSPCQSVQYAIRHLSRCILSGYAIRTKAAIPACPQGELLRTHKPGVNQKNSTRLREIIGDRVRISLWKKTAKKKVLFYSFFCWQCLYIR